MKEVITVLQESMERMWQEAFKWLEEQEAARNDQ